MLTTHRGQHRPELCSPLISPLVNDGVSWKVASNVSVCYNGGCWGAWHGTHPPTGLPYVLAFNSACAHSRPASQNDMRATKHAPVQQSTCLLLQAPLTRCIHNDMLRSSPSSLLPYQGSVNLEHLLQLHHQPPVILGHLVPEHLLRGQGGDHAFLSTTEKGILSGNNTRGIHSGIQLVGCASLPAGGAAGAPFRG